MRLAKLATRVLVGGLFVAHGTQKLNGWFDGPGIEGTTAMMEQLGLKPAKRNAYAAALSETVGGGLLAVGLFTPLAASMLTGTMAVAIAKVHGANGPFNANGGWEFNAVLVAAALVIAEDGPGSFSLDHLFGIERPGLASALVAGGAGAVAAYATLGGAKAA